MIHLDNVTKHWPSYDGWKIAPAGLSWIKQNHRLRAASGVTLRKGVILGNFVTLGGGVTLCEGVILGNFVTLGKNVMLWEGVTLGDFVTLGKGVTLGGGMTLIDGVTLGDFSTLGDRASDAVDLGWADGDRKCIGQVDGVAYIGAGCRWFTLDQALAHWSKKPGRETTMCLMMAALHIAHLRGWATGVNQ